MLTDAAIRAAKPRAQIYELDAGGCPGLKLRVLPSGAKSWAVRYRTPSGDRRRVTVGAYPTLKLRAARDAGLGVLAGLAKGLDPNEQKAALRGALRMETLFGKDGDSGWFLSEYVRTAGKLGTAKTKASIATDRGYIRNHLRNRKALMRKRVDEVTLADLNRIKADASPGAWRKVRNILRVAFRHAEGLGAIAPHLNPVKRTTASADAKIERYLSPSERSTLEAVLRTAEARGPRVEGGLGPANVRAIRLLLLTGMRRGEVLDLCWEHIDWRRASIHLPTSKTGAKTVGLSEQAVAYLKTQRRDRICRGRVCPGPGGVRLENLDRAWRKIRASAEIPDVRLHDLRHSWASDAISSGVSLAVIGEVLGHKSPATTARYAHLQDDALRDGLAKTGARIEAASSGGGAQGG